MRVRRIKFLRDRIHYSLDKKILRKLGWKNGDIVEQIPNGNFWITLCNKSLGERDYNDYGRRREILEMITEGQTKRQKGYRDLKKRYPNPNSKAYQQAMAKFNRNYLTEEEATGEKQIPIKKLKSKLKTIKYQIELLKIEENWLNEQIKKHIRKKASSLSAPKPQDH